MGKRDAYANGTFSWVELASPDREAAKRFYGHVLGWSYEDRPAGDDTYTLAQVEGDSVAGLAGVQEGEPPNWRSYVSVDDLDATAGRVGELGGEVLAGPFDVMEAGRMAMLRDPTGAHVSLWEAKDMIGAGLVNAHGAFSWNDLATTDVDRAAGFYSALLGWEIGDVPGAPGGRVVVKVGGQMNGGMAALSAEGVPPHWLVYFAVDDLDAARGAVEDGGGTVMAGPMEIPAGSMVVVADPTGAAFGLFTGELDD